MNRFSKWLMGLVALVAVGAGLVIAQDAGKKEGTKKEASAQDKEARAKAHAEREAIFKKLYPAAKTSLANALATAEKEGKGRVHSIEYTLTKDNKLTIEAAMFIADFSKQMIMFVDPDSGKMLAPKAKGGEEEEGEEDEDD